MERAVKRANPVMRVFAYAAVFILWGASFLAIREVVAVAPPFFSAGFRFLTAGLILLVWSVAIGARLPSSGEVRSTVQLGLIMFAINYACLFWAEQRVASGYAAIIASTTPVWVFAGEWLWLRTILPNRASMLGMALGVAGVVLLALPDAGQTGWTNSAFALLLGALCWAGGTLWSRKLPLPKSRHASAGLQMGAGGVFLLAFSAAMGEYGRLPAVMARWSPRLTFDMVYLIAAASIAAFLAFVWLIDHEPASRVTTHAYVNPLIAVTLGALVAGERLAATQMAGAVLVLSGVVATLRGKRLVTVTR
jgi:drug/metabolite transporter (DMT)-like permease